MNTGLKALTLGAALACAAIISCPAKAITFSKMVADQKDEDRVSAEPEPNYTVNHCFNIGNRDGYRDHRKSRHSEHNNKCLDEEGRHAYELGYRKGFKGKRSYRLDHRLSSWARVRTAS
jgi:hypothetical protein